MKFFIDYIYLFSLLFFSILLVLFLVYKFNKIMKNDANRKELKETYLLKYMLLSIILVSFFEGSITIKHNIDANLLSSSIEEYKEEGFRIMGGKESKKTCNIENSVIYLSQSGKETDKANGVVKMCI